MRIGSGNGNLYNCAWSFKRVLYGEPSLFLLILLQPTHEREILSHLKDQVDTAALSFPLTGDPLKREDFFL